MPEKDNKILKYNHGEKSMKVPFTIYVDLESLLEKMNTCHNNPEKSSITKINKHPPSGYSLFAHCSFDTAKNKFDYYRGKKCMENFCLGLREHTTKIIRYDKKRNVALTKKKRKCIMSQKFAIYVKRFSTADGKKAKKYFKVKDHCHYTGHAGGAAHDIGSLRYKIPNEIPVVFHNGYTYDYHFVIKDLAEKFEGELNV